MRVSKRKCGWGREEFQDSFLENANILKLSRGREVSKRELRRWVAVMWEENRSVVSSGLREEVFEELCRMLLMSKNGLSKKRVEK